MHTIYEIPNIDTIEALQNTRVPRSAYLAALRKGWQKHPIVLEKDAPFDFVEVRSFGIAGANQYYQEDVAPYHMRIPGSIPGLLVRTEVAARLSAANNYLRNHDLELYVFDAWRPQAVQYYCRNVWTPQYLREKHPNWSEEDIRSDINRFWADAVRTEEEIDMSAPPPHATGGAVDLTIRKINGELLNMGTGFDECVDMARIDACEANYLSSTPLIREVQRNRRLLFWLMYHLGFTGHPNEWWHYSFGDQAHALAESRETGIEVPAQYGAVNLLPFLAE